jgi:3-oxoacyl-[acyl-carrier protein] reductase
MDGAKGSACSVSQQDNVMDLELAGKHCFVTGASAGIGRATAVALAAEGARLSIAGRDEVALATTRDMIVARGASVVSIIACDLSLSSGIDAAAAAVARAEPPVDVLVNNAGGGRPYHLDAPLDAEDWETSFELNFTAARRLAEAALPAMRRARQGRIITITGSLALKRMNAATPAKAAIASWSRALSIQVAAEGITVNCIAPGRINSEQVLNRLFPTEEARRREIELNVPAGRFGEPEELAAVVTFLASTKASYVSGTIIPVDGGFLRLDLK